jgi:alkylhydroperoxidase family enzyme
MLSNEDAAKAAEAENLPSQMAELNIFRLLLRQPKLAKAVNDLLMALLFRGTLDARVRELIIMRLGWETGSVYEWTQHWRVARQLEVPEEDLLGVRDWRASDRFDETDRAVLAATDETLAEGVISPETWDDCKRLLGDTTGLLEMVAAIGCWRMISSLARSLDIPLEDGVSPWPPDGQSKAG